METRILKIDPKNIDLKLISDAANVIKAGGLVAFPTETVYGLGADAFNAKAVSRIFESKKRPLDDPLIVHIAEKEYLKKVAEDVPREAEKLMERFWPGPLTLVLKKSPAVPDIVTTGLDTVAVRMPRNAAALALIKSSGTAIAAPSANLFSRTSPTTAKHVIEDLDGKVDVVIDGGKTDIGLESTVVDIEDGGVIVLRPGGVTLEELKKVIKKVKVFTGTVRDKRSPGTYARHYAPHAKVIVAENRSSQTKEVLDLAGEYYGSGKKIGILAKEEHAALYKGLNAKILGPAGDPVTCASRLFGLLREFDKEKTDIIIAEAIPEAGLGLAVMNRLRKAAGNA